MANIRRELSSILDANGRPIEKDVLTREIAGPTVAGVRSVITGHPASGLEPHRLASILRAAEQGDPLRYMELAEQMEEKDLHYLGVLGQRKRGVAQLEITVEAAGDEQPYQADADLIRDWVARDTLERELIDILDAVGKGFSLTEILWSTSSLQWWPDTLSWVDPRWVRFDQVNGRTPMLLDEGGMPAPLHPFKYIWTEISAKSGLPVRGGLARPVSWAWMFKNYGVKDWVAFSEVYGLPLRIGKYDASATNEQRSILLRAVRDIGSDAAAIIPKTMEIDFVDGKHGNADGALFQNQVDWFDRQISKAVLGQTMTTDAQSSGLGSNQANVQDGVKADIERSDAKAIAGALNLGVVKPMVDLNHGPPKGGKYPRIVIGRAEAWDATVMMPVVERFVKLGGRVGMSVIRDRIGIPDPGKDEELLTIAPSPGEAPQGAKSDDPGTENPEDRKKRLLGLLKPLMALASADREPDLPAIEPGRDAIDDLNDGALADWERLVEGVVEPIETLLASCSTVDEARDRLTEALATMDSSAFAGLLERAMFGARLAGTIGSDL